MTDLAELTSTVQRNCHISDARYAGDYTLCIYLLKMREYYRWEKRFALGAPLPKEAVGRWLSEREQLWEQIGAEPFEDLPLCGARMDPFRADEVNEALLPEGLVYSAGYGRYAKPHFFLARLLRAEQRRGIRVLVCDHEYARDLVAPPAMTQNRTIFVRRESVRRMLWEKIEEWRWQKRNRPMERAMSYYRPNDAEPIEQVLERVTDQELEAIVLHELGEALLEDELGDAWLDMLMTVARSRAEILARAIRDLLADCTSTLPGLLAEGRNPASLHFYMANFRGMRRELFPELLTAYENWVETGERQELLRLCELGRRRWLERAEILLDLYRRHRDDCQERMESLIPACPLSQ
jgi:hypothetical protein